MDDYRDAEYHEHWISQQRFLARCWLRLCENDTFAVGAVMGTFIVLMAVTIFVSDGVGMPRGLTILASFVVPPLVLYRIYKWSCS